MLPTFEPSSLGQQPQILSRRKFSAWNTFKHHIPRFLATILIDIIFPLIIYFSLQKYVKPVYALLAASSPPLFMVIFKAIWFCAFDAIGFVVFISFAISGVVAIITRNPIVLLLEKSLLTGILSLIFAVTLIPFNFCYKNCRLRPLAYYVYHDLVPTTRAEFGLPENVFNNNEQEQICDHYTQLREEITLPKLSNKQEVTQIYEWIYAHCSSFRNSCYILTSIWALGFLLEFLFRLTLILVHLPVNLIVIYGHIVLSTITVICIVLTIICIANERKYTLLFIEEWNVKLQQIRTPEVNSSFVTTRCNSNVILNVNT